MKSHLTENDVARVRQLIGSGLRAREVAELMGVIPENLSSFMQRHDIRILAQEKLPPPDLSMPDRTVVFTSRTDSVSGAARIKRTSLPAITMHRAALCEKWRISQ
tara:strand:+ start:40880 stop:41194 length:315 start_codon:yes stop_codon:yes gene_type:complete